MARRLFAVFLLIIGIAGCSRWPTVDLFGDEYALSPFPPDETLSVPSATKGSGKAEADSRAGQ